MLFILAKFSVGPATNLALRRVIVERTMTPDILVHGLVTPSDVEKLFEMFVRSSFNWQNPLTWRGYQIL